MTAVNNKRQEYHTHENRTHQENNKDRPIIKNVCFVGAGTMGSYNALVAALADYKVTVFDTNEEVLKLLPIRQQEFADIFIANGLYNQTLLQQAIESITCTTDLVTAVAQADLVSESVFEQLDIKRNVHQQLDQTCPVHTILTTNSSALMVSDIEDVVLRGDKFAALHTHLLSPLVDIVAGPRTSADIVEILQGYVQSIGAVPLVLKKENSGYVLNTMISKLLSTALLMVADKQVTFETLDRIWMQKAQAKMGPFGMIDMFGLDVTHYGLQIEEPNGRMKKVKEKLTPFIKAFIDKGLLGVKAGKGFYQYPNPTFKQQNFLAEAEVKAAVTDKEQHICQRLEHAVIIAAILLAENGIVKQGDVDKAWMVGMMLPKGPFTLLKELALQEHGIKKLMQSLNDFVDFGSILPSDAEQIKSYLKTHPSKTVD